PKAFIGVCDKFIFTENLRRDANHKEAAAVKIKPDNKALLALVRNAVEDTTNEAGWSYLGSIGQNLINKSPEFDPRSYGHKKLLDLIESLGEFEFKFSDPLSGSQAVHVRLKRHKRSYEK
ncbi:OST-HTH/LOTUS domain-containing protein, partial [Sulfuricurvum kujiense]